MNLKSCTRVGWQKILDFQSSLWVKRKYCRVGMSNNEIAGSSICSSEIKTLQRSRSRSRVDYHEKD